MVTLNEADPTLRSLAAEALKVHELISLNRFPATRMLPAADLHNDIHGRDLRVMLGSSSRQLQCPPGSAVALSGPLTDTGSCRDANDLQDGPWYRRRGPTGDLR